MTPVVVEKDFWVCYILSLLFSCPDISSNIIFKGGTCLSKVFKLIERFSEDIDLILNWNVLTDEKPQLQRSRTQQNRFNQELESTAISYIHDILEPKISELVTPICSVTVLPDDGHVLQIDYPSAFSNSYILPYIKLEIGPLAAWCPNDCYKIQPYIAETFPKLLPEKEIEICATKVERIFWEKITILHSEAHRPINRNLPLRYSRHYYDVYKMAQSPVKKSAFKDLALLKDVTAFKKKFYYARWANYDSAKPGSMVLSPPDHIMKALSEDYKQMHEMIYGDYPDFSELMDVIKRLEFEINSLTPM
jgi:predicted nucleotidyltransferase component of viral defense system